MASNTHSVKWTTPTTLEILKTLKSKFVGSELKPYDDAKVWLREDGRLVLERSENLWKDHFKRRRENTDCGFFSTPCEPFKCLGGPLTLDVNDLLYQSYSSYLKPTKRDEKSPPKEEVVQPVEKDDLEETVKDLPPVTFSSRLSATGYGNIRDLLEIQDERKTALKGGMPYMDHIRKIEKRMEDKKEKPINGMVLMSTSDFAFMFGGARESVASAESMSSVVDNQAKQSNSSDSTRSNKSSDSLLRVNSGLTERLDRLRKDNVEFLNTLYRIITIMKNLKSVDLKTRQPLTRNKLKDLETSRKTEREHGKIGTLLQKRLSTDTSFSVDLTPTTISSHVENRHPLAFGVPKRRNRILSLFGSSGVGSRTSALVNDKMSRPMLEPREHRVDTWDDLLHAGDKTEGEQNELPVQVIPSTMMSKALRWSRRNLHVKEVNIEDKHMKPVWQNVANERAPSAFGNTKTNTEDAMSVCQRARSNMEKVNKAMRESCDEEVKKINRHRIANFRHKFDTLREIDGTTLFEKQLWRMREPKDFGIVDPDLPDIMPSKWLDELKERMFNIVGNEDTELTHALKKLCQYSQMEIKNIPQTKAKLCLIVMSLAAYDICKISTQLAIKFILEKIIQVPVDDFYNWLGLRKLPVVIVK
ncbi:hypothetical protein LOTGIDRAFT_229392 [Lottia gigantea]|uniref:Uncharacterized protein n=1 Tax=Lottia gigantea TaxID=225164 RepID=V3ZXL9_LOTGI|nr:hypothetical protein LOTGIDRAFT_229392 [Lottia gigantea]ESO87335.1 hypothetical protein LOTGIDRAFT_229392 [Lottia gigantea]